MMSCYEQRIIPYHIYVFDETKGADHFRVDMECLLDIFHSLSKLPGPAQPVFVAVDNNNMKRRFVYDSDASIEALKLVLNQKMFKQTKERKV